MRMMKESIQILMPKEVDDKMEILMTMFSPTEDLGITIVGEDFYPTSKYPTLRIYLIRKYGLEWAYEDELHVFTFQNYDQAHSFLEGLPGMSAFDLIIAMNNQRTSNESAVRLLS